LFSNRFFYFFLSLWIKPDSIFSDLEKYKIDQFVMKGGKVIWLVESLSAELDSLDKTTGVGITKDYPLNLNDILFKYGVRINYNLIQDLQCHLIPLMNVEGSPQQEFRPWIYFPLIIPNSTHPIVNNLNAILFRFTNSIDTVGSKDIKKTILLTSSPYSRLVHHIVRINLQQVREEPNKELFQNGNQAGGNA